MRSVFVPTICPAGAEHSTLASQYCDLGSSSAVDRWVTRSDRWVFSLGTTHSKTVETRPSVPTREILYFNRCNIINFVLNISVYVLISLKTDIRKIVQELGSFTYNVLKVPAWRSRYEYRHPSVG